MELWGHCPNIVPFTQFTLDAATGTLPNYAFIEPSYFLFPTDQHPPHPVDWGDALIAEVYHSLRSSNQWTSSMLIVTYDEHGGT